MYHLQTALKWFKVRTGVRQGYFEERWFAMSKSAEICERFYGNYTCSLGYWNMAKKLDPDRWPVPDSLLPLASACDDDGISSC